MIKELIIIGLIITSGYYYLQAQEVPTCTQTQNYLATPYQANPNNLEVPAELEIIKISESLNTS